MSGVASQVAVWRRADGVLDHLAPAGLAPAADDALLAATPLPAGYSAETWTWSITARAFVEDAARVGAALIQQVKTEAERRKMLVRSPGSGKGAEYRRKRDEAMASATVLGATLNALTKPAALQQYPAAASEAALTGEALATVLTRYRDASNAADAEVLRIAAIEANAVRAIRSAATAQAKRAALAAIDWAWKP